MAKQLNFGEALEALKNGYKVARYGWNGKDMYLLYYDAVSLAKATGCYGEMVGEPATEPAIAIKTAQNTLSIGWRPTSMDMLSEDWFILSTDQE